MRFFTGELWRKINDTDEAVRTQAQKEWRDNDLQYAQEFEAIKKQFPQGFIRGFLRRGGFHDFTILGIWTFAGRTSRTCELLLTDGRETVKLSMDGVKALRIDADLSQGNLEWGYSEFGITPEGTRTLSVLCAFTNELYFEFRSIKLTEMI